MIFTPGEMLNDSLLLTPSQLLSKKQQYFDSSDRFLAHGMTDIDVIGQEKMSIIPVCRSILALNI